MRSAVEFYGYLTPTIAAAVDAIRAVMAAVPDNGDRLWSCHAVTRGLKAELGLDFYIEEGFFARRGVCHAWFAVKQEGGRKIVIDVLPMGAHGGPLVADASGLAPFGGLYIEEGDYYARQREAFEAEGVSFARAIRAHAADILDRYATTRVAA